MTPPPIGYYVHNLTSDTLFRARHVIDHLKAPIHFLGPRNKQLQLDRVERFIEIPPLKQVEEPENLHTAPHIFHSVPLHNRDVRERMCRITQWIINENPTALIVDGSLEVIFLARLFGIPTIGVRLHGCRHDPAHKEAFKACEMLIAPFPESMEQPHLPDWILKKTFYTGAFSRFDDRQLSQEEARQQCGFHQSKDYVLLLDNAKSPLFPFQELRAIARHHPDLEWMVINHSGTPEKVFPNLTAIGSPGDLLPILRAVDVVVSNAASGTVNDIAAAECRYIAIPEPSPFDEQLCRARALENLGLATVFTEIPYLHDWTKALSEVFRLDLSNWEKLRRENKLPALSERIGRLTMKFSGEDVINGEMVGSG